MPSYGFHALEVLSHEKTNPFSKNRSGISLGEGGALFVVTKTAEFLDAKTQRSKEAKSVSEAVKCALLLGIGETSDAYHSATPDPDGTQAVNAIQLALKDANLKPEDIDYINLHGTGTISNDLMEANAIYKVFGDKVPASSTKPLTGHCLGAAASIEAFICYQILKGERNLPIHKFDGEYDENLPKINLVNEKTPQKNIKTCMSTSFGFGGTNAVMILAANQQNDVGIAMPTYKTTSNSNLAAQPPSCLAASCLPHSTPMVLIDDVLNVDMENQIVKASVKIHKDKIFFDKEINGISPLVGIEFMAQTIGCYAYFKANHKIFGSNIKNLTKEAFSQIEKKPSIGFLLGTRLYENSLEKFENEKTYIITAQEIYGDDELVSFECLIYNEKEDNNPENYIAKATINAFQPNDVKKYIKELE